MFSAADDYALQCHFNRPEQTDDDISKIERKTDGSAAVTVVTESRVARPPVESIIGTEKLGITPRSRYGWRFLAAFASLCLINLVCAIDATILVNVISSPSHLNGTAIEAFWAGTSFLLTSTVFQPTWASLSHIVGRKPILLVALVFFTVGSIICTAASGFLDLLVGRSIQGIGGGGMVALTYIIVSDMIDLRSRGKWFGYISLQWAIGSISGPVLGGAFVEDLGWRAIFILNFPFIAIAFVSIPVFLRLNHKVGSIMKKLRSVDWLGSFLFVSSLTSFLIPLTWGGIMYDWSSWRTLCPLLFGIAGLAGFMMYSRYLSADPLIRGSIFSTATAKSGYAGTVIHGIITWSLLYYMPLYYGAVQSYGPVTSGVAMFPLTCTTAPAAVIVGLVIAKTGRYRPSIYVGWSLTTLGMGLNIILKDHSTVVQWIFITLVPGTGLGILYSAQSFAVQAGSSNADLPFAAAMYSFFRSLGQTFGVALGGVIFQNMLKNKLLEDPLLAVNADTWARDASMLSSTVREMSDSNPIKARLINAYVESLRVVWISMCALAALGLLLSVLFIRDISLDRVLETDQGFRHISVTKDEESCGAGNVRCSL
ncbi:MAG: hypothetical protein M1818_002031 [Claussenomyces sp. TS43310]|nr:MAG: hypothetical protein M1818_002031 [Claussenomyces sp. TS43310]